MVINPGSLGGSFDTTAVQYRDQVLILHSSRSISGLVVLLRVKSFPVDWLRVYLHSEPVRNHLIHNDHRIQSHCELPLHLRAVSLTHLYRYGN